VCRVNAPRDALCEIRNFKEKAHPDERLFLFR
jgi:hypothetical protein